MGKPDALSRQADHGTGEGDNEGVTLLQPELFHIHALSALDIVGEEKEILRDIQHSIHDGVSMDPVARAAQESCKDPKRRLIWSAEWQEVDGLLMF